ncbi:MAG: hypothetical protein A2Y07_07620 [Planctomycetes bacterium GWF2_50_10]|nr:MAG: hypothetical protein A2Y07_07620 [Planctomycetes bacterium GWF2_50_10]
MQLQFDIKKIIKRHSALVLPIGITVAAVLVFVPTFMIGKKIKTEMEQSVSLASQVDSFSRDAVSAEQWKEQAKVAAVHEKEANSVERTMLATSMRELLAYNVFPKPVDDSTAVFTNFGKSYRAAIDELVTGINGRDVPTEEELREMLKQAGVSGNNNSGMGTDQDIVDQICKDRAAKISVYANPDTFPSYNFWNEYQYQGPDTAVMDCWKTQIAYWISKDVVDTIGSMNSGSAAVSVSPVKRLVGISFVAEPKANTTTASATPGTADMPSFVGEAAPGAAAPTGTVASVFGPAWTGRSTNDDMDVVHFAVTVVVNAKSVLPFMAQLCSAKEHTFKGWDGQQNEEKFMHNQITVLKSTFEPVAAATAQGGYGSVSSDRYRYGHDPVVQLSMVCEYVFMKPGYKAVKPGSGSGTDAAGGSVSQPSQPSTPSYTPPASGGSRKRRVADDE